jgi:hypothetical protein
MLVISVYHLLKYAVAIHIVKGTNIAEHIGFSNIIIIIAIEVYNKFIIDIVLDIVLVLVLVFRNDKIITRTIPISKTIGEKNVLNISVKYKILVTKNANMNTNK